MTARRDTPDEPADARGAEARHLSRAMSLGTSMAAGMLVFSLLGYWADRSRGGGAGVWTLVGMFAGLLYGGYEVWKVVRQIDTDDRKASGQSRGEGKK